MQKKMLQTLVWISKSDCATMHLVNTSRLNKGLYMKACLKQILNDSIAANSIGRWLKLTLQSWIKVEK